MKGELENLRNRLIGELDLKLSRPSVRLRNELIAAFDREIERRDNLSDVCRRVGENLENLNPARQRKDEAVSSLLEELGLKALGNSESYDQLEQALVLEDLGYSYQHFPRNVIDASKELAEQGVTYSMVSELRVRERMCLERAIEYLLGLKG